MFVGGMQGRC